MTRVPAQTWVTILGCCVLWTAFGSQIVEGARKHDFLNLYTGASLALDGKFAQLYDPGVQLERERRFVPQLGALVPFVRPHFYAALLAPLALIPFRPAFWVWLAIQTSLLLGCWGWASRLWGPDALIFGALYLPTALGIAHGQDCVLMLLIVIVSYSLAARGKGFASGAALGLGVIKFHLFLLWPLALVLHRRWRMLTGLAVAAGVEVLLSLLLAGPSGLVQYANLLRKKDIEHLNPSPELTISVHGLALNLAGPSLGEAHLLMRGFLVALVIIVVVLVLRRGPLWRLFCAASAGSLLVAPHVYGYDAGLLLLAIWLAVYCSENLLTRVTATVLATPIPFMLTLAGSPWAAAAPLAILFFLSSLAAKNPPTRMPQIPESS